MTIDTICALCTPVGQGALSVIRVSGPKALDILRKQARFLPKNLESHHAYVGVLKQNDQDIDQVVITFFEEGKSFTGEQTVEISCHGGMNYNLILEGLLHDGARLAEKGEFSYQSFANGKMDLVQVEGLLKLIESRNETSRQMALKQLQGNLSKQLEQIEKQWMSILANLEADIDFSLEDISTITESDLEKELKNIHKKITQWLEEYQPAQQLEKGLSCVLYGPTNSGKSSLFNALLNQDKAIVSDEEGTTRDVVESVLLNKKGLNIHLQDTAGMRLTESEGERLGQQKSQSTLEKSQVQIFVFDHLADEKNIEVPITKQSLLVFTKQDLDRKNLNEKTLLQNLKKENPVKNIPQDHVFFVSSLTGHNISKLKDKIFSFANQKNSEDFVITNYRHYEGLQKMLSSLNKTLQILQASKEKDLMALEMREGLLSLYEILGRQIDDKILDNIFSQFCIGK